MAKLTRVCTAGSHIHVKLEGGKAKDAALYTDELCHTICGGLRDHIDYDEKSLKCMGTMDLAQLEAVIRGMVDTAEEYMDMPGLQIDQKEIEELKGSRAQQKELWEDQMRHHKGSHGDLPP